jgi:hypothetical protein
MGRRKTIVTLLALTCSGSAFIKLTVPGGDARRNLSAR